MREASRRNGGFTLIELLVAVAVLAIVTSLAVTSYRQYVRRAARVDARSALLRVAAAQEKYYAQNGQYAGDDELALAPPAGLGITGTERGHYTLSVTSADADLAVGFTAQAKVDAAGSDSRTTPSRATEPMTKMRAMSVALATRKAGHDAAFHAPASSSANTLRAIASHAVSPGDPIPNRFTSPATPCAAGPWITKSPAAWLGPDTLGRMPV